MIDDEDMLQLRSNTMVSIWFMPLSYLFFLRICGMDELPGDDHGFDVAQDYVLPRGG